MSVLIILSFNLALIVLHELGHLLAARALHLRVNKVGVRLKPLPHFFVAVRWPKEVSRKAVYLFSGPFVTWCLFLLSWSFDFFGIQWLFYAFLIQIVVETNPFFSDFTIAQVTLRKDLFTDYRNAPKFAERAREMMRDHQFGPAWYVHFILWTILICVFIQLKNYVV